MNSQKLLIISVVAALLILGGAIAFVKFKPTVLSPAAPITQDTQIAIQDAMSTCTTKEQCIVVDTTCSFCCKYVAINTQSEELFNQLFDQTCKNYNQSYCECHDLSSYPSCVDGKCQMVKWSENKPLKIPPVPAPAPLPVPAPTPATVPDDLYAPLPEDYQPALPDENAPADVVQP